MSSSLLFLPATETVYRFLTSLSVSVHINHRRWDWLWGCFGKRGLESLPFLKLSPHPMEYWLCMTFIWMANRWYYCLRTWKLVSQEQHKAARLAWAFSCAFESVVSISQGIRGTGLWEMEFAGDQLQPHNQRCSKKCPWCDLGVQITRNHFSHPFLPSFLFQIYWGLI